MNPGPLQVARGSEAGPVTTLKLRHASALGNQILATSRDALKTFDCPSTTTDTVVCAPFPELAALRRAELATRGSWCSRASLRLDAATVDFELVTVSRPRPESARPLTRGEK